MTVATAQSSVMAREGLGLPTPYEAPQGKLETAVTKIFADVFGIDQVGANDDFFDIGGDSIVAETISMEILQRTGCEFPMSSLLDYSTPRTIAAALAKSATRKDAAQAPVGGETKGRPPIFVVHGRRGYTMPAPQFIQALADGQRLRMFELPGIRGGHSYDRIEDIAEAYIGQLNDEYPEGPVLLASFCAGGLIALEMAARLAAKGRPVKHLVLIDPPMRKNGTLGFAASPLHLDLLHRTKRVLLRLLPQSLRLRYYDLKWNKSLRSTNSALGLSTAAQAKLYAAFADFYPPPYSGPVTILASSRRMPRMQEGSHAAQILPSRTTVLVFDQHKEVASEPRAAELMQEAFSAVLAEGPERPVN
jgi:thioesterase domain-containing protein/acyl carrier protein